MARDIYYSSISKDKQIEAITKELSQIFIEDSNKELTINLYALKKSIKEILENVKILTTVYQFTDKKKKVRTRTIHYLFDFERKTIKSRQLLIKGYMILMNFLEVLTGQNIDYRCYYIDETNKDSKEVFMKSFKKEEILQKLIAGTADEKEYRFALDRDTLEKEIKNHKTDSEVEQNLMIHFNNLYNSLFIVLPGNETPEMVPGWSYGFRVKKKAVIVKYGNPELYLPKNLFRSDGKYRQFNRGHIIEGLDISIFESAGSKTYEGLLTLNYADVKEKFFTKNLSYDNIKGFKQGDNTITGTQIKMFNASLMNYSTIYNYLERLYKVLNSKDKDFMTKELTDMFYEDVEKVVNSNLEKTVNNISAKNKIYHKIKMKIGS